MKPGLKVVTLNDSDFMEITPSIGVLKLSGFAQFAADEYCYPRTKE